MSDTPSDLKYTKDHEWARVESGHIRVGITLHAVEALGDITLVNFSVKAGDALTAGQAFGTVESVKTLSDVYSPVAGTVVEVHAALGDQPEKINEGPYTVGWMLLVAPPAGAPGIADLMDADGYQKYLGTL